MLTNFAKYGASAPCSQILAGDAAVSGGVLPSAVSGNEEAEFAQRVQETPAVAANHPCWLVMM